MLKLTSEETWQGLGFSFARTWATSFPAGLLAIEAVLAYCLDTRTCGCNEPSFGWLFQSHCWRQADCIQKLG